MQLILFVFVMILILLAFSIGLLIDRNRMLRQLNEPDPVVKRKVNVKVRKYEPNEHYIATQVKKELKDNPVKFQ